MVWCRPVTDSTWPVELQLRAAAIRLASHYQSPHTDALAEWALDTPRQSLSLQPWLVITKCSGTNGRQLTIISLAPFGPHLRPPSLIECGATDCTRGRPGEGSDVVVVRWT